MRIKRQRRKLRGKYSGNCLSCDAKWSKCWYIASVENQGEWESRLNKTVTPAADEVCFQCWDAKIRTSPKRKLHYKSELPLEDITPIDSTICGGYPLRPAKRVDRNKRRALNEDYAYDLTDSDLYDSKGSSEGSDEEEEYYIDENDAQTRRRRRRSASSIYHQQESVILDEENAVFLLSTAFNSIPHVDDMYQGDEIASDDDDHMARKRGVYYQKGHGCDDVHSPTLLDQMPSPSSPGSPPPLVTLPSPSHPASPSTMPMFQSPSVSLLSALLAQPVGY